MAEPDTREQVDAEGVTYERPGGEVHVRFGDGGYSVA